MNSKITRRTFIKGVSAGGAACILDRAMPSDAAVRNGIVYAQEKETPDAVHYRLVIKKQNILVGLRQGRAITINGVFPGPIIRLRQGKDAVIQVKNELSESTSVHWHGIILPFQMDGVPGVVFPGIDPGETFTYRFPVRQSGTYWYHSHTGLQEQLGHYGPLVCMPEVSESCGYDREHIVVLSDWTFEDPLEVLMHLKKWEGYYNYQKRTLPDLIRDIAREGLSETMVKRAMWARMRMNPRDMADVTGATYTYLFNGMTPDENHILPFRPGEQVRLRIINASAATYFDFRIPGLHMQIIQADGQDVQPVSVNEFRIAVAETYDVIVQPREERAYSLFAEAMDRSGFACASLSPSASLKAHPPARREPTERGMEAMDMPGEKMKMNMGRGTMHNMEDKCGICTVQDHDFPFGPDAAMVVKNPRCMVDMPGAGLTDSDRKILTYADLKAPNPFSRKEPDKLLEIHLTGNMERFIWKMWAWDGKRWSSQFEDLLDFPLGERIRIVFVNHSMMDHPIHLHGTWMYLQNGSSTLSPRKHTVNIKPAEKLCVDVDADAFGNWAFHCHILYHMHTGMFRVVKTC